MATGTPDNTKQRLGIRARLDAKDELIRAHSGAGRPACGMNFDEMVEENRVRLGLPRRATSETPDQIRAKLERTKKRIEKYEQLLAQAEADERLSSSR